MRTNKLTKLEECFFIINRVAANIEALKEFQIIVNKELTKNPKQGIFLFHIYNSLYLYIYHFITEFKRLNTFAKTETSVKDFFKEISPDLKKFRSLQDKFINYRNGMVGHYYRDKQGNFVHALDLIDKPCTSPEILFFSEYCITLTVAIRHTFKNEWNSALSKMNTFEKDNNRGKEVDIDALDKFITELKKRYNKKYK